jgi:hypothetical protein
MSENRLIGNDTSTGLKFCNQTSCSTFQIAGGKTHSTHYGLSLTVHPSFSRRVANLCKCLNALLVSGDVLP